MILVVVIAVAWLVILIPGFLRRRSQSGETDSISHFHRQLRILEHSAPSPIVAPAYRLRGGDGDGGRTWRPTEPPNLTVVGARDLPRPNLAFLADAGAGPLAPPTGAPGPDGTARILSEARPRVDAGARQAARQRRRDTLTVLVLALLVSFVIGFLPGAQVAWVATGVLSVALAAYVGLLVHLRRLAEERDRKLRYLPGPEVGAPAGATVGAGRHHDLDAPTRRGSVAAR